MTRFCDSCQRNYSESMMFPLPNGGILCEDCNKMSKVNHPSHYQSGKFEVIDIIEEFSLNFNLGNVIKYILRAGKKENLKQDLEKARWYLSREIDNLP